MNKTTRQNRKVKEFFFMMLENKLSPKKIFKTNKEEIVFEFKYGNLYFSYSVFKNGNTIILFDCPEKGIETFDADPKRAIELIMEKPLNL